MANWLTKSIVLALLAGFAGTPAHAAWHEAKSKHFVVYADSSAEELKSYAEKLERFDAAFREARGVPDVAPGQSTRVTLFMVRDLATIRRLYGGSKESGVAGFYIPRFSGSVAFVPEKSVKGKWMLSPDSIFFHEYSHHLMLQDADRPLPTWLTEGFAEFFANPEFKPDGSVMIGKPPVYRAEELFQMSDLPLEKMISGDFRHIDGWQYTTLYGRGWLLTHLLSFDLKRRGQLPKYLDAIQAGVPSLKAAEDAFGDLKSLDRELKLYFKADNFTATTIPASKLRPSPVAVRPLTPGETRVVDVRMRLARGGRKLFPGSLVGTVRRAALEFPEDAAVLTTLAQIELAAEHPKEANEAADRALQLAPDSFDALIAKGKAMMALAKENRGSADWNAVRSMFLKANKIDAEAAEPLVLFYRTYIEQGIQPTSNAVDGLTYAVVLAPQDSKLRMELIGRLFDDNRLADARKVLIPIAYSPHVGKWRDAVVAILEQLDAGNRDKAKSKWAAVVKKYYDEDDE